jgi:hypothetical protein
MENSKVEQAKVAKNNYLNFKKKHNDRLRPKGLDF